MYKSEVVNADTGISAKVVCHSKFQGSELLTIETCGAKFSDAEFEKHRMITSNSSSDRAVPWSKMIEAEFFIPQDVRLNQAGMQGYKKIADKELLDFQRTIADLRAHVIAELQPFKNIHKQHLNRYLLPWSFQNKVATQTKEQWQYFLDMRTREDVDPPMFDLASCIRSAIELSNEPVELSHGDWHLPYITESEKLDYDTSHLLVMSSARCARVSFMNHDKESPTWEEDLKTCNFLKKSFTSKSKHLTPFEHQAKGSIVIGWEAGVSHYDRYGHWWSGNFPQPWIQHRKILEHEINE